MIKVKRSQYDGVHNHMSSTWSYTAQVQLISACVWLAQDPEVAITEPANVKA